MDKLNFIHQLLPILLTGIVYHVEINLEKTQKLKSLISLHFVHLEPKRQQ